MVGVGAPDEAPRLTVVDALGRGFLTALATGPFGNLLILGFIIAPDAGEPALDPLALLTGIASMLTFGSIIAIIFAVVIGWLPISLFGWLTQNAAARWPLIQRPAAWIAVGAITGALCLALASGALEDLINEPDRFDHERLQVMLLFGGACGIFAALFFRWLGARARRQGDAPVPLVTEHLP